MINRNDHNRIWYQEILGAPDPYQAFSDFVNANADDPGLNLFLNYIREQWPAAFDKFWNYHVVHSVGNGDLGSNDAYGELSAQSVSANEETSKYLDNLISQQNTATDRQFQTEMRDTSLTSAAGQLQSLGLSPSNVIQVGGASSGVNSQPASQNMHSAASLKQQERINSFNQKMSLAKSLISTAGSMASSGIYGAALGAIKNSAQKVAGAAAHSGLSALSATRPSYARYFDNEKFEVDKDGLLKI